MSSISPEKELSSPARKQPRKKSSLSISPLRKSRSPQKNKKSNKNVNRSMAVGTKSFLVVQDEDGNTSPLSTANKRRAFGNSSSPKRPSRKMSKMMTSNISGLHLHALDDDQVNIINEEEEKASEAIKVEDSEQPKRQKDSDDDSSDVESMMREVDPMKRHVKQLKIKHKNMERKRQKPLPKLSYEKRGWNAPLDEPYVPVGRMTELVTAMEQVRSNLPHTRDRFKKQTYRQMLMVKKRERDLIDKHKKMRAAQETGKANLVRMSLSASSMDDLKMEDASRVVANILPSEQHTLIEIRNYTHDETVREMRERRLSAPAGPRLNKFGRMAAGYVSKRNEKRDYEERERKMREAAKILSNKEQNASQTQVIKSDIELQMEKEKSRHWIRKRNGRIYDEKIKNLITTTDNGSSLLKQEIQESETRLASVKIGRPLAEVVAPHPKDYFLTNKEDYFLGDKRILRRQERETIKQEEQLVENVEEQQPQKVELGQEFQTIGSSNEIVMQSDAGGFFLTEQPLVTEQNETIKGKHVKIPDLLGAKNFGDKQMVAEEEPLRVSQMFANAHNYEFEQMYRATTSSVKGQYLKRVQSRENPNGALGPGLDSRQGRANSISTAEATTQGFYRTSNPGSKRLQGQRMSETVSNTLNTNLDSTRLMSAMSEVNPQVRRVGTVAMNSSKHNRVKSQFNLSSKNNACVSSGRNQKINNSAILNRTSCHEFGSGMRTNELGTSHDVSQNLNQSHLSPSGTQSQMTFNQTKRLLKDARTKRTKSMCGALQEDVSNKRNRVRYLQNLQKERTAQKKLDQAAGSNIFTGFSKDEIHEILVEMPQLKKMQKERDLLISNGPEPPKFSNAQLIHLDSLNDIANRGQAELRKQVHEQINKRKESVNKQVSKTDELHDFPESSFIQAPSRMTRQAAILRKFQQSSKDGDDDQLAEPINFHDILKERLNFADARQQTLLYQKYKNEDFVHKIWDENGPDHKTMDSDRAHSQAQTASLKNLPKRSTLLDQLGTIFNEQQQNQMERQNTSATSLQHHGQLTTGGGMKRQSPNLSLPVHTSLQGSNYTIAFEGQRQIDDEAREYDHSDQAILLKLIEVYEKRIANQQKRRITSELSQGNTSNKGPSQNLKVGEKKKIAGMGLNKPSSMACFGATEDQESTTGGADQITNQDEAIIAGLPNMKLATKENMPRTSIKTMSKRRMHKVSRDNVIEDGTSGKTKSNETTQRSRPRQTIAAPRAGLFQPNKLSAAASSGFIGSHKERQRKQQMRKDYRRFVADFIVKEYWRCFDAIIGSNERDMQEVINHFSLAPLYRNAQEFLVTKTKSMSEDHLIHLKEDPKTILSLYRMHMLHFKTTQINGIEKKLVHKKPSQKARENTNNRDSGLSLNENEESDYSDGDFQDLMSNKQIEDNIRVFFDRMHELVNPIDQQRLKLDSVQQIKSTVKTFYKRKAEVSEKLLMELDQMSSERPLMIKVKQEQFNDPQFHNQANLHAEGNLTDIPTQQCKTRMADIRLNAELFRLRKFKNVARQTSTWYNVLATEVLAQQLQDEPLVLYFLDQIKHVIEMGDVFSRMHFRRLMDSFDSLDANKPEVITVRNLLNELLPRTAEDELYEVQYNNNLVSPQPAEHYYSTDHNGATIPMSTMLDSSTLDNPPVGMSKQNFGGPHNKQRQQDESMLRKFASQQQRRGLPPRPSQKKQQLKPFSGLTQSFVRSQNRGASPKEVTFEQSQ